MSELSTEKRVLIAFALSILVVVLSSRFLVKPPPQRPSEAPTAAVPVPEAKKEASAASAAPGATPQATPVKMGEREQEIALENDLYRVVLSTRGGLIKSWRLKKYRDEQGATLELVHPQTAEKLGFPGSLILANRELEQRANTALYAPSPSSGELRAPAAVTLEFSDGTLAVTKKLSIDTSYVARLETTVLENGRPVAHAIAWRGGFGDIHDWNAVQSLDVIWYSAGSLARLPANKVGDRTTVQGDFQYAGLEDRYFAAVFLPITDGGTRPLTLTHWKDEIEMKVGEETEAKKHPVLNVAVAGPDTGLRLRLFVGPKATDVLASAAPGLDALVDFGVFWFIAKPLFIALKWLHSHGVPNYGWAIITLTLAINLALFPLKHHSLVSAQKMQKLAPQLRAIQEKYKKYKFNDPRRQDMNAEMMALYKEHGVNPLGGCVPLLLQLPFFYAFYKMLAVTIEMRQAPWIRWWIKDLSAPDPTVVVLPGLMTISMYVMQKMTPVTTTDPMQQRMFSIMPIMFGVMFIIWQASSGLVLYWLVSNVVGIGQQWYINRKMLLAEAEAKEARKRRRQKES